MSEVKLGDVSFITKLAGFEHTKYIQGNNTHEKISEDDVPLFIGKTVQNGKIDRNFDWYIPKQISDQLERSKLNKKCLVLPYVGSVGDLAIFDATYDAHLGSNIAKIELACNSGYSEEFIYYFLKSDYGQKVLLRDIQGAIQKNITMKAIRDVSLPDISIQEQDKIVSILKSLDDKIDNNNQINQELETMAKILYDYWFVQFDFPDQNGKPYKSSGGKMVYHPELKREIPEGWGVEKIENIAQTGSGGTPKSTNVSYYSNGEIPWINSGELEQTVITSTSNFITEEGLNNSSAKLFPSGTILVAMYGATAGKVSFLTFEASTNQAICAITLTDIRMRYYLKNVIEDLYQYLVKLSTGSARDNLSQDMIKNIKVVIPSNDILDRFYDFSNNIIKEITKKQQENEQLTQLCDWLLPMLMNGQVKVEDFTI